MPDETGGRDLSAAAQRYMEMETAIDGTTKSLHQLIREMEMEHGLPRLYITVDYGAVTGFGYTLVRGHFFRREIHAAD